MCSLVDDGLFDLLSSATTTSQSPKAMFNTNWTTTKQIHQILLQLDLLTFFDTMYTWNKFIILVICNTIGYLVCHSKLFLRLYTQEDTKQMKIIKKIILITHQLFECNFHETCMK